MYNLTTYFEVKMQLERDIKNCHEGIDFYLLNNDHLQANILENRIKKLITRFNIMFDCKFKE